MNHKNLRNDTTTNDATGDGSVDRPTEAVLVITDDSDDPGLGAARAHAGELAARAGVPVILYDRSEETWGDSPHPEGPIRLGDARLSGRAELEQQMVELRDLGADPAAWLATLPSLSAVTTALSATGADVVVVAESMDRKLLERALAGDSVATALREQLDRNSVCSAVEVLEVSPDGGDVRRVAG